MAGVRNKAAPSAVGSAEWVKQEREQLSQFFGQEKEDFVFSVRNDTEWLNEHMAEIFSSKQLDVKEIFKTPGKLRGKTPRTVRGKSPERAPLTEIFSADKRYNQSPSRASSPTKAAILKSPLASSVPTDQQFPPITKPLRPQHDSGYHGSYDGKDVDHDMDIPQYASADAVEGIQVDLMRDQRESAGERTTTERSFHSAKEDGIIQDMAMDDAALPEAVASVSVPGAFPKEPSLPPVGKSTIVGVTTAQSEEQQVAEPQQSPASSSIASSPAKPLLRKSSLTFAALPAREPLGTKKSIGNQVNGISASDASKGQMSRSSYLGRFTNGQSLGGTRSAEEDKMDVDDKEPTTQIHNKDSTQRLHDRIILLGKTQPGRNIKNTAITVPDQPVYPDLATGSAQADTAEKKEKKEGKTVKIVESEAVVVAADLRDATSPISKTGASQYPTLTKSRSVDVMESIAGKENVSGMDFGLEPGESEILKTQSPLKYSSNHVYDFPAKVHTKAASTVDLSTTTYQPIEHQKQISVSNPEFPPRIASTTPAGSPVSSKFHLDGHLSASKQKMRSIMKTARGIFTSSARVSNQAKMEILSPNSKLQRPAPLSGLGGIDELPILEQPVYPKILEDNTTKIESPSRVRKTRSSTEREKELKRQEKAAKDMEKQEADLAKAREQERLKAAKFHQEQLKTVPSSTSLVSKSSLEQTSKPIRSSPRRLAALDKPLPPINSRIEAVAAPPRPQSAMGQASKTLQPPRRPVRPVAKDNTFPKVKQPPVNIRIGPLSGRTPLTGSVITPAQEESAPLVPAKHTAAIKKPSTASQHTNASTASLKSSVSSNTSRARAPITKKIERKPTAHEEGQKRMAERAIANEEAKKLAYKQAAEKRTLGGREQPPSSVRSIQTNKAALSQSQRLELGSTKAPKSNGVLDQPARPPTAMSLKAKRVHDDVEHEASPIRAAVGQNYQAEDGKRRRTGEKETVEPPVVRPAEAPPIRYSNIRKDPLKMSVFGGNYPTAPPPAAMHADPARSVAQVQMHPPVAQSIRTGPNDMAKFADGRIPFASHPNPPQHAPFKTPLQKQNNTLQPPSTFSPMLPNPENILLDEIETSEEDEDSEDERQRKNNLPEWTRTPNMNAILLRQETIDTDAVFGSIAPANLEEWFPKDKNRLHKLRARTSSANWFGADRLTEDEVKRDLEARQKMSKEGGWSMSLAQLNE